jgi:hypothetical protein
MYPNDIIPQTDGQRNGGKGYYLLDLSILNSFLLLISCGSKLSQWHFRQTLPTAKQTNVMYDTMNTGPWEEDRFNVVCSGKNVESRTKFKSPQCNVQLCASPHFKLYHMKLCF